jgi:hypothetical protein
MILISDGLSLSDSSVRLIWVSSTKWCHEWLATFHIYRHKHFFSASHSAWYALSLLKSVPHPVGFSCVGPRPKFISGLCYVGFYPRCIIVWFLGALAFETRLRPPPATPFVLFGKSAIGSTTALASTQQCSRILPGQARHLYNLNLSQPQES